jgi:riboflavin kinase / FMN adenylyltransferase
VQASRPLAIKELYAQPGIGYEGPDRTGGILLPSHGQPPDERPRMQIFRSLDRIPGPLLEGVAALGNFDGVHRGHQAVIAKARALAHAQGRPLWVVTFEPHPRRLFRPDDPPFRLTPLRAKARLMADLGVDAMAALPFNRALASQSAADFVALLLRGGLATRHVVAGHDFAFGRHRGGDIDFLIRIAAESGFVAHRTPPCADPSGAVYSSTVARRLLQEGEPEAAAAILGRPWELEGRVMHGDKRGRTLGFPTANLRLGPYLRPRWGVYAVQALLEGDDPRGPWREGAANLGRRPTVAGIQERLEVHLFDAPPDFYGRRLRVRLRAFIRPERSFAGLEALSLQIREDCAAARSFLAAAAHC